MSTQRRRIITGQDVEAAAYAGTKQLSYDPQSSIVTPLARARANDLGVALRPTGVRGTPGRSVGPSRAVAANTDDRLEELRPELAAEVLRRVQRRLEQQ